MLHDKVAVVTGGGQGLGLAIAKAFAAEGAHVILVGRKAGNLQQAVDDITAAGGSALACPLDINDVDAGDRLVLLTHEHFGRWDVLVNSAGAFIWKRFVDLTDDDWQLSMGTNLTAPFRLTQRLVRHAVANRREGAVINIGSIHGVVGDANAVPQCASKFGLLGLTKAAAEACREHGVRVNAISPGAIESESSDRLSISAGGRVTQADVAQLAVYLASDRARFVTGVTIDAFGFTRPVISNAG